MSVLVPCVGPSKRLCAIRMDVFDFFLQFRSFSDACRLLCKKDALKASSSVLVDVLSFFPPNCNSVSLEVFEVFDNSILPVWKRPLKARQEIGPAQAGTNSTNGLSSSVARVHPRIGGDHFEQGMVNCP